jgi:outer membrane protein, multidrug efflux system
MRKVKAPLSVIAALFILAAISGCAIGPDYQRPSIDAPPAWRLTEPQARDLADTAWWEQFGDPVLNNLIVSALKENKDLRIAAARVEEFMGRYGTTRAALFPQVSLGGIGQKKGISGVMTPPWSTAADNPYGDFQTFSSASWEIDIWGRLRRATEAARADLLATEEGRKAVILTVTAAVAISYTDLRHLDKQLEIAERTAKSREHSFDLFNLRFDRGLISELELRQVESEYRSAQATIPLLQKLIAQQENGLSVLLGRNPGPIPRGKHLDSLTLPVAPAGLPSELLERRPDLRLAEQSLIAANARIGVAKALYFPIISLTGSYGVESAALSNLFTGPAKMWSFAMPITMPVFTAGAIAGQVRAAEAVREQSLQRYQAAIQQAFREVEDALIDQRKSREQLVIQKQQVEALRSYASLANVRYENGYTSFLEVLDAERSLFNAELAATQTQDTLFRSLVNLYKSMGGGWVAEADKLTPGGRHDEALPD